MFRKGLSLIMCFVWLFNLLPIGAFAAPIETNFAQGKSYQLSNSNYTSGFGNKDTIATDGNVYSNSYINVSETVTEPVSITVDLKAVYSINKIKVWHYWKDGRKYHGTKTEVSADGTNWVTVFDAAGQGEYPETEYGKMHVFETKKVRYIRDWANGSSVNGNNHWVEIQAFGPAQTGTDAKQELPINEGFESTAAIQGLTNGKLSLTQDKVKGKYAVKVDLVDNPNDSYSSYKIASSPNFSIKEYSTIKIWVKPGSGSKWIKFWVIDGGVNTSHLIKSDKDSDGYFAVGQDIESGKWNQVTLNLKDVSSNGIHDLWVHTNDLSSWSFDEAVSVYTPVYKVDLSKMVSSQTRLYNGAIEFIPNGADRLPSSYNATPSVITTDSGTMSWPILSRDSVAFTSAGALVEKNVPRFENGKIGKAILLEESTRNLISSLGLGKLQGYTYTGESNSLATRQSDGYYRLPRKDLQGYNVEIRMPYFYPVTQGTKITESFYFKHDGDCTFEFTFYTRTGHHQVPAKISYIGNGVKRAEASYLVHSGDEQVRAININRISGNWTYIDIKNAQLEVKNYSTTYISGSRSEETLTFEDRGILNTAEGTIEGWVLFRDIDSSHYGPILTTNLVGDPGPRLLIMRSGNKLAVWDGDGHSEDVITGITSLQPNTWFHFAYTWSSGGRKLYINGKADAIGNRSVPIGISGSSTIGGWGNARLNGFIDDLRVSTKSRSDEEILIDFNSNQTSLVDQYTSYKLNFDGNLATSSGISGPSLPKGRISEININSDYKNTSGSTILLPDSKLILQGVTPTTAVISGNGKVIYYVVDKRLWLLNLDTGENQKVSEEYEIDPTYSSGPLWVSNDGHKVAFRALYTSGSSTYDYLCIYDLMTKTVSRISDRETSNYALNSVGDYSYYNSSANQLFFNSSVIENIQQMDKLSICPNSKDIYYSFRDTNDFNKYYFKRASYTHSGWVKETIKEFSSELQGIWVSPSNGLVVYRYSDELYGYQVKTKAITKLGLKGNGVVKIIDDNWILLTDGRIYNIVSGEQKYVKPTGATTLSVTDDASKIAYASSGGLSINYPNGVQRPERYLLSFDSKNTWHTYKDGVWSIVKIGGVPVKEDFDKYGLTIDQVNALNEADFDTLYADGREIYNVDVAVYFASIDPLTTPSLKSISVIIQGNENYGDEPIAQSLYVLKQQDFNSTKWRRIKKVYPVELQPKQAETYYMITADGQTYKSFKNGQWNTIDSAYLQNLEGNWINITQKAMTIDELRSVPEDYWNTLLPTDSFAVAYVTKAEDTSTAGYTSQITVDYVESQFESANLILKVTLTDGSVKEYSGLTKTEVEDFMNWLGQRQFGKGPIFYCIKTPSTTPGTIQVNQYINYYSVLAVDVNEME